MWSRGKKECIDTDIDIMTGTAAMDGTVTKIDGGVKTRAEIPAVITTTTGADNAPGIDQRYGAFYNVMKWKQGN
jgi:hypothetical protein